jgi:hypothetical protein
MSILTGAKETRDDKADRIHRERETVFIEAKRDPCSVDGTPVTVGIAWINIYAAFCPITPYDHYIARNGGYFETRYKERIGATK